MDILLELVKSVLTLVAISVVGIVMAGLFITILALATGIDSNIQPEDDRPT